MDQSTDHHVIIGFDQTAAGYISQLGVGHGIETLDFDNVQNIYSKLGVENRTVAVLCALDLIQSVSQEVDQSIAMQQSPRLR